LVDLLKQRTSFQVVSKLFSAFSTPENLQKKIVHLVQNAKVFEEVDKAFAQAFSLLLKTLIDRVRGALYTVLVDVLLLVAQHERYGDREVRAVLDKYFMDCGLQMVSGWDVFSLALNLVFTMGWVAGRKGANDVVCEKAANVINLLTVRVFSLTASQRKDLNCQALAAELNHIGAGWRLPADVEAWVSAELAQEKPPASSVEVVDPKHSEKWDADLAALSALSEKKVDHAAVPASYGTSYMDDSFEEFAQVGGRSRRQTRDKKHQWMSSI
jgi:hypothetical protein